MYQQQQALAAKYKKDMGMGLLAPFQNMGLYNLL